jgi:hypothetical protein
MVGVHAATCKAVIGKESAKIYKRFLLKHHNNKKRRLSKTKESMENQIVSHQDSVEIEGPAKKKAKATLQTKLTAASPSPEAE